MMNLFAKLLSGSPDEDDTPSAARLRMSLEERKAYRREMLYQSIRECLLRLEALASMYRFRVMNLDERHHRFIAMMEVTPMFEARQGERVLSHTEIEGLIKTYTWERYGVVLQGMFWRVDESNASFTRNRRASDPPGASVKPQTPIQRQLAPRYARQPYEPVSERERQQFAQALRAGQKPPPLRVGTRDYQSDLAPLGTETEVGGTQYGQL